MSDRTTLEIIAPTVEEALSQGLSQLGLTADAVSVEVLDSGSKGLFGLGGRQVRVRLTVNPLPGEEIPVPKPVVQTPTKPAPAKRAESAPKAKEKEREAKPRSEKKPAQEKPVVEKKIESGDHDPILDTAEAVVSKLINHLGMKAQVSAHFDESATDDRRSRFSSQQQVFPARVSFRCAAWLHVLFPSLSALTLRVWPEQVWSESERQASKQESLLRAADSR